jgi:hypothetical protein
MSGVLLVLPALVDYNLCRHIKGCAAGMGTASAGGAARKEGAARAEQATAVILFLLLMEAMYGCASVATGFASLPVLSFCSQCPGCMN